MFWRPEHLGKHGNSQTSKNVKIFINVCLRWGVEYVDGMLGAIAGCTSTSTQRRSTSKPKLYKAPIHNQTAKSRTSKVFRTEYVNIIKYKVMGMNKLFPITSAKENYGFPFDAKIVLCQWLTMVHTMLQHNH